MMNNIKGTIDFETSDIVEKLGRSVMTERRKVKEIQLQFSTKGSHKFNISVVFDKIFLANDEIEDYRLNLTDGITYASQKFIEKQVLEEVNANQVVTFSCPVDEDGFLEDEYAAVSIQYSSKYCKVKGETDWFGWINDINTTINRIEQIKVQITNFKISAIELRVNVSKEPIHVESVWIKDIIAQSNQRKRFYHTCHVTYENLGSQFHMSDLVTSMAGDL